MIARMGRDIQARLRWIQMYQQTRDAGLVCQRYGISRPTLRKWLPRYEAQGMDGLQSLSRRPRHSPLQKITKIEQEFILQLRGGNLGTRRIQSQLLRQTNLRLSLRTIPKVLTRGKVAPL